jgi:DNA-directed RNA polymerase specialized sigma24 family protein
MTPFITAVPPSEFVRPAAAVPAESAVAQLLRQFNQRAKVERAFRTDHKTFVARAAAIIGNPIDAEDAASQTYLEMLREKTDPTKHGYRALRFNALDLRRRNNREARRGDSIERFVSPASLSLEECAWGSEGVNGLVLEPISDKMDDRDPLDILIAREDEREHRAEVRKAMRHPDWRFAKRNKWARPLLGKCAETVASRE